VVHFADAAKQSPKRRAPLSVAKIEIVGQFNDYASENPKLSFVQVAKKVLGSNPFPKTPNGRKFWQECKSVFDRERKS
jgi:hypothetical protein